MCSSDLQRAFEFFSDTSLLPALTVKSDRFRLRTILVNLIRTAAALSDGHRLWLEVQAEASGQADGFHKVIFTIEDNGHLPDGSLLRFEQDASGASSLDGVWLAKTWTEEMGGFFTVSKSPRGGHAFQVTLPLEVVAGNSSSPPEADES